MRTFWNPTALLRSLRWHRRAIAVIALLVCGFSGLGMALAPQPTGSPVLVTTHALAPGTTLAASDVRVALAPVDLIPAGALTTTGQAIGLRLAVGQPAGAMMTDMALVATDALSDVAAGEVLVPFQLADPDIAPLLTVGMHLSVVASQVDGQTRIVAQHVRVASLPGTDAGGLLSTGTASGVMVLVATDPATGQQLAGARESSLGVMLEDG
jgi:Flp pilus assembly protein CpaB